MDRNIDLTDKGDFTTRRLPKKIKLCRLPWQDVFFDIKAIPWFKRENKCERCGAVIKYMPWESAITGLCNKCSLLLEREEPIWQDKALQDKRDKVFLSDLR